MGGGCLTCLMIGAPSPPNLGCVRGVFAEYVCLPPVRATFEQDVSGASTSALGDCTGK